MAPTSRSKQQALRVGKPYVYGKPDLYPNLHRYPTFRFTALEPGNKRTVLERVEASNWDDVNAILTGQITVRDPSFETRAPILNLGDRVLCQADIGAGFAEVWTMRCGKPQLTASNLQRQFSLTSDLDLLNRSIDELYYRKDHAHPNGWRSDQIIRDICARYKVPVGPIARGPGLPTLHVKGSPLDAIRTVVKKVRRIYGIRWVIRFDNGELSVTPLRRSQHLLALGPTLIEAQLDAQLPDEFASAVMMRANPDLGPQIQQNDSKGRRKQKPSKLWTLVSSPTSISRFGYVRRTVVSPDAASTAEMRQQAKAWLAAVAKPVQTVTLTHYGMPFLKRGDAIQLAIGDWGMRRQIVFVNQINHSLSASAYRMTVQCIFADPYVDRRGLSILYRLVSSTEEAQGRYNALTKNMGFGSPQKNDTTPGPYTPNNTLDPVPGFTPGTDIPTGPYGSG